MMTTFLVTFVGKATPATIKELAGVTNEHGGKWLVSKINFLDNQVAAAIKIELPEASLQVVQQAFTDNKDLLVNIVTAKSHPEVHHTLYKLRLDAEDRPGIVNDITHTLDEQHIDILDMDCQRVFIASSQGVSSSLFTATLAIRLPDDIRIENITAQLQSLGEHTRVMLNEIK